MISIRSTPVVNKATGAVHYATGESFVPVAAVHTACGVTLEKFRLLTSHAITCGNCKRELRKQGVPFR